MPTKIRTIETFGLDAGDDFWNEGNFRQKIGGDLVTICSFLAVSKHGQGIAMEELLERSKRSLSSLARWVDAELAGLTLKDGNGRLARHLKILAPKHAKSLCRRMRKNADDLRGMEEGALVVCGSRPLTLIRAGRSTGYVSGVVASRITYPNACFRDGDFCDILVSSGDPVEERYATPDQEAYPESFKIIGRCRKTSVPGLWFAISYELGVYKVPPDRNGGIIL